MLKIGKYRCSQIISQTTAHRPKTSAQLKNLQPLRLGKHSAHWPKQGGNTSQINSQLIPQPISPRLKPKPHAINRWKALGLIWLKTQQNLMKPKKLGLIRLATTKHSPVDKKPQLVVWPGAKQPTWPQAVVRDSPLQLTTLPRTTTL